MDAHPTNHPADQRARDFKQFLIVACLGDLAFEEPLLACVSCAYRDFNRTLRGIAKTPDGAQKRKDATALLATSLDGLIANTDGLTQPAFDKWHQETCARLAAVYQPYELTVGQCQKWINMTFKYVFALDGRLLPLDSIFYPFCHLPLDSVMIERLQLQKSFRDLHAWSKIRHYTDYRDIQQHIRQTYTLAPLDLDVKAWNDKTFRPADYIRTGSLQ